ncbi:MAG: hypothetical protein ACTHWW_06675 [Arthrobacter sp.]|uniref:hypothetical protein n=1 Tax=unclassified Arthrobacter TaxID=235627 RepID=UPI00264B9C1D|nr:hypothetical protein [Micrococcaceae bacterium]MDN5812823.1 hypothetical protein [Micrococcaceae bacterium]MDN5824377.1 hypothetical protein [Micrococcaceae bacterium]MDN5878856.1 hypothetical protein [Micrococcaceae bacterium]MDN5886308.1 hypothetical protein [Micrococcaceae bacterium]
MNIDGIYDSYVRSSARYCRDLFRAAQNFFAANALVEDVITGSGVPTPPQVDAISSTFAKTSTCAIEAVASVQEFAAAHNNYPDQQLLVDSDTQQWRLRRIAELGERIANMTSALSSGADLQEQIWAEPEYTRLFTEMADIVCTSVTWQRSLALETHGEL